MMDITIKQVRNVEIEALPNSKEVTVRLTEYNGSFYGSKTDIKIPASSYEKLETAIVEKWLEKKKDSI